jgi:DNA-binding response OmpR family regulator
MEARGTVWVVGPDADLLDLLAMAVARVGWDPRPVAAGDAQDWLGRARPAAAIVDLGPPVADYLRLARRLRQARVPVLLLSAREAGPRGGTGLVRLGKPFSPAQVGGCLAALTPAAGSARVALEPVRKHLRRFVRDGRAGRRGG